MQEEISFGVWLRKQRRALDLSRKAFADQIGCAQITLRRIEAGTLKPSEELANILLDKLGVGETERPQWVRFARGFSNFPQKSIEKSIYVPPATNLPTRLTTFIGRERETDEIIDLIAKNRLVTLVGTGGIGKTRISLQVGERILRDYPHGVWFVPFDSLSDRDLVLSTVAAVFDFKEASERPVLDILMSVLHKKSTLLIFDNCEHLVDACAHLIATLLTNCPHLKILATSREVLGVEGEVVYTTPSLAIPEWRNTESIRQLSQYESVVLFAERAGLAMPFFNLTNENAVTVGDICRTLDGIPLAIELAAARVEILQVNEILKQLKHCLDLLISNNRNIQPKHQTMRASLDWSWGLLTEDEQRFLQQLSVFAGGWTLESAQAVCQGNILNLISALVKKSFITADRKAGNETRYHFHEVVRQYLHEKLLESGEEANIRTRHLQYFLQLSEHAEPALTGPTQVEWMSLLNDERDNIRAALEWADNTDVEAGLYLASQLNTFWEIFDVREGSHWLENFIQKSGSKTYHHARAKALCALGWLKIRLEKLAEANSVAQESLNLYRICGDKYGEVDALLLSTIRVNPFEAREFHQQALSLAESINDKWRKAYALSVWDQPGSHSNLEQALVLFREVGDLRNMAACMIALGRLKLLNNEIESAQKIMKEAMILLQRLKLKSGMSGVLQAYGRIAALRGDYEQAYAHLQEDAKIAKEYGYRRNYLFARAHLGYLALNQGHIAEAHEIFRDTLRSFFKDKTEIGVAFTIEGMAGLSVAVGKPRIAAQLIGWADSLRKEIGDPRPLLEQADVDKIITVCLAKMEEVAFSDLYDEGQEMTLDEAVSHALKI